MKLGTFPLNFKFKILFAKLVIRCRYNFGASEIENLGAKQDKLRNDLCFICYVVNSAISEYENKGTLNNIWQVVNVYGRHLSDEENFVSAAKRNADNLAQLQVELASLDGKNTRKLTAKNEEAFEKKEEYEQSLCE